MIRFNNYVYYEGEVSGSKPLGQGTLYCHMNPSESTKSGQTGLGLMDELSGEFGEREVTNASLIFASGWVYHGTVSYHVSESGIRYTLSAKGTLSVNRTQTLGTLVKRSFVLPKMAIIGRAYNGFQIREGSGTYFKAIDGLNTDNDDFMGFPMNFLVDDNFEIHGLIVGKTTREYENWEWGFDLNDTIKNEKGHKLILSKAGTYRIEFPKGEFMDSGQGTYKIMKKEGLIAKLTKDSPCTITYRNGDKFVGEVMFVDTLYGQNYKFPSLKASSPVYVGKLVLDKNILPFTGTFTTADGNSFNMIDGKTEEELMAQAEAELEEQQMADQRRKQAQQANAKKVAEQRKLLNECNGKTFSFNQYFTALGGKWQVTNGNASIKFWKNGQEIIVRISGTLNILEFREITADGELSCYEAGNPLYGSWYIKIINNKGKKAFVVNRPLGGLKYLLQ